MDRVENWVSSMMPDKGCWDLMGWVRKCKARFIAADVRIVAVAVLAVSTHEGIDEVDDDVNVNVDVCISSSSWS